LSEPSLFVVIYKPGPRWKAGVPFHEQPGIMAHRDFLLKQYEAGALEFGGPFLDHSGGLAAFEANSCEDLERLLNLDETIANGLQTYELHPLALPFKRRS
jgi:uncharacterized protein YciI